MTVLTDLLAAVRTGRVEVVDLTAPLHSGRRSCSCRRRSPTPRRSRSTRSAGTTSAARPGTGTTSPPASTPAPTSTRRCTGSPARTARTSPRCRPPRLVAPAAVLDLTARGAQRPRLPARGRAHPGLGGRARPAARRRLAAATAPAGTRARRRPGGVPQRQRDRPAHARHLGRVRALAGRAGPDHRRRGGDGRHRRRARRTPSTRAFPCHSFLLGAGKYGLTQLQNLAGCRPPARW